MPATSWLARAAWRAPHRISDTSSNVTFSLQCSITGRYTNITHEHISASTLVVQWSALPRSMHEIMSSNPGIMHNFAISFFKENMAYRAIDTVYRVIYCYILLYIDIKQIYKYILIYIYQDIYGIYHDYHGMSGFQRLILMLLYMYGISPENLQCRAMSGDVLFILNLSEGML